MLSAVEVAPCLDNTAAISASRSPEGTMNTTPTGPGTPDPSAALYSEPIPCTLA